METKEKMSAAEKQAKHEKMIEDLKARKAAGTLSKAGEWLLNNSDNWGKYTYDLRAVLK